MYHVVFALLVIGTLIEYNRKETPRGLFLLSFAAVSLLLALRFGQGTDYFAYSMIYNSMPLSISGVINYTFAKAEIGWRFICMVFRMMGLPFKGFVFLLSGVQMVLLWRFLSRYCKNRMLALLLGYHTLILTYFFSALRQSMVIAVFLGVFLQWLLDGKLCKYCIGVLLCSLIHSIALILLLPVIFHGLKLSFKQVVCFVAIGFAVGLIFSITNIGGLLENMLSMSYLDDTSISLIALGERVVTYVLATYIYYLYVEGQEPEHGDALFKIFKVYSLGVFLYCLLMWSPLISSRTTNLFKILELALISSCIVKSKKARSIVMLYCVMLTSVMYYKNISSYITQGYYQNTSVVNYPYVTVFNPEEIEQYRADVDKYRTWLEFE